MYGFLSFFFLQLYSVWISSEKESEGNTPRVLLVFDNAFVFFFLAYYEVWKRICGSGTVFSSLRFCGFLGISGPEYICTLFAFMLKKKKKWFDPRILAAGNVVCSWGRGEDGQLGHGDAEDRLSPTQLSALDGHDVVSVTCGADHTTAYSVSRVEVYSWGWSVLFPPL